MTESNYQNAKGLLQASNYPLRVLPAGPDYEPPYYLYDGNGYGFYMDSWPEYGRFSTYVPDKIDEWPDGLDNCYLIDLIRSELVSVEVMFRSHDKDHFSRFLSEWNIKPLETFKIEGDESDFYLFLLPEINLKNFVGFKHKDGTIYAGAVLHKDFIPGPNTLFLCGSYTAEFSKEKPIEISSFPFVECLKKNEVYEENEVFESVVLSDVKPERIEWLWYNRIPLGMVTLLAGYGGEGKSYFTAYLAAQLSRGESWPDGSPCPRGGSVFLPGEDPIEQVFKPRLETLEADTKFISVYKGYNLEVEGKKGEKEKVFLEAGLKNLDSLKQFLHYERKRTGSPVKMLVIDPVTNFLDGVKENSNSEIRALLSPLCDLARAENIAVVLVSHFKKGDSENNSAGRVVGSIAFTTVARAVWFLYADKADRNKKSVVFAKGNILVNPTGLEFRILENGAIEFTNTALAKNADDIEVDQFRHKKQEEQKALSEVRAETGKGSRGPVAKKRQAAEIWLETFLSGNHCGYPVSEIKQESKEAGFNWITIQRAANVLNVHREKLLTGWNWSRYQDT